MNKVLNEKLINQILSVVACIPVGKVATYGQIAQLIGRERNARLVGRVLSQAELYGKFPCHRVVNSAGRLAPAWEEQRHLLWAEGVTFKTNGCVDLKKHQWKPTDISKV
ncbi:MGMT family protein [Streptococcus anginosus]|uniref:Methylated-DNA-[protein]-cysteine S-methyltransferase, DNA-binding domain protein n=1 Tax=Streptococcus anginosus subsp. whileyi CCUG 39159 TaxID=1095729 RepID=I0S634_STRAP|nr:MGMT family protein [Streptococcus anginosus]AGU83982.1 DNA methyltransferase protein [Streptococcus anginosus C238]EID18837.1 methylated-DNA-[protein]-cysteine S-methyltransferase, DNA-binding domain protein [Streptococcus anginosus subsp. whileyi CCUG 39159]MDB8661279.1 MGMT family protein [Streptococcus anginosus]MDP1385228.1 MGMT family protein [Streptococcus anginosus]QQT08279.1 MGMT family protein [Streptococcus anginosus]